MKNLFVTYELAEKLKEKGFDNSVIAVYNENKSLILLESETGQSYENNILMGCHVGGGKHLLAAPTYNQIIDWLINKHKIHLKVSAFDHNDRVMWYYVCQSLRLNKLAYNKYEVFSFNVAIPNMYDTYHTALEKATTEAIKTI